MNGIPNGRAGSQKEIMDQPHQDNAFARQSKSGGHGRGLKTPDTSLGMCPYLRHLQIARLVLLITSTTVRTLVGSARVYPPPFGCGTLCVELYYPSRILVRPKGKIGSVGANVNRADSANGS